MKTQLSLLFLVFVLLLNAQEKTFLDKDLVPCDTLVATYYELETEMPDVELVKSSIHRMDGSLFQKGYYQMRGAPERSGTWMEYYPNGQIANKKNYSNGKIVGIITKYYPNGNLMSRYKQPKDSKKYKGYVEYIEYRSPEGKILINEGAGKYYGSDIRLQNTNVDSLSGIYRNGRPFGEWIGYKNGKEVLWETFDKDGLKEGKNLFNGKLLKYKEIFKPASFGMSDRKFNWDLRKNFSFYYEQANPDKTDYKIKMRALVIIDDQGVVRDIRATNGVEKSTLRALIKAVRRTVDNAQPTMVRGVPVMSSLTIVMDFESRWF